MTASAWNQSPGRLRYLFNFIGFSQQMMWAASAQPHAVSTVTARPQTPQAYLLPFFIPVVFLTAFFGAVFFATVFFAAVFTAVFLVTAFFEIVALAINLSFPR